LDISVDGFVHFVTSHRTWAPFALGMIALADTLAATTLFIPSTAVFIAIGAMIGKGAFPLSEMATGAFVGYFVGDTLCYWIGRAFGSRASNIWLFRSQKKLLERGTVFFRKYGWLGVFAGRFTGPLRAVIPVSAGIMGMGHIRFQTASITSALTYILGLFAVGAALQHHLAELATGLVPAILAGLTIVVTILAVIGLVVWRKFGVRRTE
jgi:membrane protein DedA with SNARE-associated domain